MGTKRVFKSAEELKSAWNQRMAKINAQIPQTFKEFCVQCQQVSVQYMNQLIYGAAKRNARTGTLKRREKLVAAGVVDMYLVNDAKSGENYPYAVALHEGRKELTVPTKNGKMRYAWLKNRAQRRPASDDGAAWRELVKSGQAVVTDHVAAMPGRPWRTRMVENMKDKMAKLHSAALARIFSR